MLAPLSPRDAAARLAAGATLVDVRSPDEFARAHVAGAKNLPLGSFGDVEAEGPVIFMCRSGARTGAACDQLAATHSGEVLVLDGGLDAWRKAGLPVAENARAPLELQRQVFIAAGLLILTGVALGFAVAPGFFGLSAFVGAGLTFAGVTGWCGMAKLLALMPWNRVAAA